MSAVVDLRVFETDHPDLVADIRAEAEHVGRLSRATLERLSCDCEINRVITDGPSHIIDVGRTTKNRPRQALAGARDTRSALPASRL